MNGDGITGVKMKAMLDKTGGLYIGAAAGPVGGEPGQEAFVVGARPSLIKDLSTALLSADGKTLWAPASGRDAADSYFLTDATDAGAQYDLYRKTTAGVLTRYSFDLDNKYIEDSEKDLNQIEVSSAEKAASRDLNGDRVIGAAVTTANDKVGGLYQASIGADSAVIVTGSSDSPGKSTDLGATALLTSDGETLWSLDSATGGLDAGFTLRAVVVNHDGSDISGYSVYAAKGTGDSQLVRRFNFDADRMFTMSEDLHSDDLAKAEADAGRDLNSDKALGLVVEPIAVDKKGGLFKATLLGDDYYVVGSAVKTGRPGATTTAPLVDPVSFDNVLYKEDGVAWAPEADYYVGGVVTLKDDDNAVTGYDVYTYKVDATDVTDVTDVKLDHFGYDADSDGPTLRTSTESADPIELVAVEAAQKRDLSGDGAVGFRTTFTPLSHMGVTEAKVYNSATYWVAGDHVTPGSVSTPLTAAKALLNEAGDAPWVIDGGYTIQAVDESESSRDVYATKTNSGKTSVIKYSFNKVDGHSAGDGEFIDPVELARLEVTKHLDLNGDGSKGITTALTLTTLYDDGDSQVNVDAAGPTNKATGLLKAKLLGQDFLVVKKMPSSGVGIDLSQALLKDGGIPWSVAVDASEDFVIKGIYQHNDGDDDVVDVYGLIVADTNDVDASKVESYRFKKIVKAWIYQPTTVDNSVSRQSLAETEADALKDLNGDGSIGFKPQSTIDTQANGWAVGKAGVGSPSESNDIYIVGKNLDKMGASASNLANTKALWDGDSYWKPDAGYVVKSLVESGAGDAATVSVYATGSAADGLGTGTHPDVKEYVFNKVDGQWSLDASASASLSALELVADEVGARRDLDKDTDNSVGLAVAGDDIDGLTIANVLGQNFYLVGDLAAGTEAKPLGSTALLWNSDGEAAWRPADDATLANFTTYAPAPAESPTAKYSVDVTLDGTTTTQYFDSLRKAI